MNVQPIKMDPAVAAAQLEDYRRQLRRRNDAEYRAVARGLEALAQGHDVVLLSRAIAGGGVDDLGRPRLAIARADAREVRVAWDSWNDLVDFDCAFNPARETSRYRRERHTTLLKVRCPRPPQVMARTHRQGFALVPMIPATVRERCRRFRADQRFILWEVERWAESSRFARPDHDPLLLRRLSDDLYSVEAQWDLTPLEQAAMAGRALS